MLAKSAAPRRRLLLLRHAKSAWPDEIPDHDRPLAERGRKAAADIGAYMARVGLAPDLVLVSTARRAAETWRILAEVLPSHPRKRDVADLYAATPERILDLVHAIDPSVRTAMLVGHNPGFQETALLLAGNRDAKAYRRLEEKFPTAGLAVMEFATERWEEVAAQTGSLQDLITPRSLA